METNLLIKYANMEKKISISNLSDLFDKFGFFDSVTILSDLSMYLKSNPNPEIFGYDNNLNIIHVNSSSNESIIEWSYMIEGDGIKLEYYSSFN